MTREEAATFGALAPEDKAYILKVLNLMVTDPAFKRELHALPLEPGSDSPNLEDVRALVAKYRKEGAA